MQFTVYWICFKLFSYISFCPLFLLVSISHRCERQSTRNYCLSLILAAGSIHANSSERRPFQNSGCFLSCGFKTRFIPKILQSHQLLHYCWQMDAYSNPNIAELYWWNLTNWRSLWAIYRLQHTTAVSNTIPVEQ